MTKCLFCERNLKNIKKTWRFNYKKYCSKECQKAYNQDKGKLEKKFKQLPKITKYKYCKKCGRRIGLYGTPRRLCNKCRKKNKRDLKNMTYF